MRLIDADKLKHDILVDKTNDPDVVNYYINMLDGMETQQTDAWIPISSGKLPDKEGDYLVYDENKQITIEYFYKNKDTGWCNPYFTTDYDVIAWKPIAPYKEE